MKNKFFVSILIISLSTLALFSCGRWKVSNLHPKEILQIKNGITPGEISLNSDEYALKNLSFSIGIFNDNIYTTDNSLKRIQILDMKGKLRLIISNKKSTKTPKPQKENFKKTFFKFNILGAITMDEDDNIYVQNRLDSKELNRYNPNNKNNIKFSPSYVLVFDKNGKLQYTLGQNGSPNIPFYYIENLNIDKHKRLFVISRSFNTWSVFRFVGQHRDFYRDLSTIPFIEKEDNDTYKGKIENVKMYRDGESILISVAYYYKLRFKYRKIYKYSIAQKKIIKTIMKLPDPKNVLFNIVDDKLIYFWNMDGDSTRFMIANMEGNILNNLELDIKFRDKLYTNILGNISGSIISYSISTSEITLTKWE